MKTIQPLGFYMYKVRKQTSNENDVVIVNNFVQKEKYQKYAALHSFEQNYKTQYKKVPRNVYEDQNFHEN